MKNANLATIASKPYTEVKLSWADECLKEQGFSHLERCRILDRIKKEELEQIIN